MKFGNFEMHRKQEEELKNTEESSVVENSIPDSLGVSSSEIKKNTESVGYKKKEWFHKVPLTEEDKNLSVTEYSKKYGISTRFAYDIKKQGYRNLRNPEYVSSKDEINKRKELRDKLKEVTPLNITSLETIWGNLEEQAVVKEVVNNYYSHLRYENSKGGKRFRLINGKEITLGDLVTIDKIIDLKLFRNEKGELMMFSQKDNDFVKFNPTNFFGKHKTYSFRDNLDNIESSNPRAKYYITPLETFAPEIFKSGFFKEEDFSKRTVGSSSYQIYGPHERSLSATNPGVSFTNSAGRCLYYIGRDNFTGTKKKINHETVRVSLLDDNTGVITDVINGRKVILYTFPLITKDEIERQKHDIIENRSKDNRSTDIRVDDFVNIKANLKEYLITDYVPKNKQESDVDYANRISKLSDTSYVLGNFKSFMSETGLAANNYSWREQLVLADALTAVSEKNKLINFSGNFGKDGIRTFLSVEQGGVKMSNKILELGDPDKLPKDVAEKVFAKYGEIIDVADKAEEEVRKLYEKDNIPNEVFVSIKETLLKRGSDLLSHLADGLSDYKQVEEDDILKTLEDIKTSTIIMGESYLELYKQGIKISIEEIKDTTLEKIQADGLSEQEKQELIKVYEKGRPKETYENKEHLKLLTEEFRQTLNNEDTFVFNIRLGGELIAFATFNKESEDTLHIGGLTFIDDIRNPVIGESVMNSIMKEFSNFNIKALVHSENKILRMYQKRFGFEITGELPREENAGELYYEIEKRKESEEKVIGENNLNKAA
jgi:hypothetical protein